MWSPKGVMMMSSCTDTHSILKFSYILTRTQQVTDMLPMHNFLVHVTIALTSHDWRSNFANLGDQAQHVPQSL